MITEWLRSVPHFKQLPIDDQVLLIQNSWFELLLVIIAYRTNCLRPCDADKFAFFTGYINNSIIQHVHAKACSKFLDENRGFVDDVKYKSIQQLYHIRIALFDRLQNELVAKLAKFTIREVYCLMAVILYDPAVNTVCKSMEHLQKDCYGDELKSATLTIIFEK